MFVQMKTAEIDHHCFRLEQEMHAMEKQICQQATYGLKRSKGHPGVECCTGGCKLCRSTRQVACPVS